MWEETHACKCPVAYINVHKAADPNRRHPGLHHCVAQSPPPPSPPTPSSDYSEKNLLGFSLTGPQGQRRRGRQARESIFKRHIGSRSGVKGRRASPGGPEEARRRWVLLQTARSLLMGGDPTNSSGTVVRIAAATADNAEENRWHTVE